MRKIISRRHTVIVSIVATTIITGNLSLYLNKPIKATAEQATLDRTRIPATLIAELSPPNVTLPRKPATKPAIHAKSYIVLDNSTKYPLAGKNPDTKVPIASTTKIMTSLVASELLDLDQVVTVSNKAATIPGSEIQLLTGEKMSVRNLIQALLISSANDAAWALAEASGSSDQFIAKMNDKAKILGLKNTFYKDPAGLDDTGQSSPRDLALLTHYAIQDPTFRSIIKMPKADIFSTDNRYRHELTNSNRLILPDEPLYYPASIGGKTGFTFEAGHCLVAAAAHPNGRVYVAVILNTIEATKDASAKEARKLLTWAALSQ